MKSEQTNHDNAYLCDIELDATCPIVGRTKRVTRSQFVHANDGRRAVAQ